MPLQGLLRRRGHDARSAQVWVAAPRGMIDPRDVHVERSELTMPAAFALLTVPAVFIACHESDGNRWRRLLRRGRNGR